MGVGAVDSSSVSAPQPPADDDAASAAQPDAPQPADAPAPAEDAQPAQEAQPAAQSNPVRDRWNTDSFEASRPRAKLDLSGGSPPPPANTDVEAPQQAAAAPDPDAERRGQIDAELAKTETGRQAQQDLTRTGAQVSFEDGNRSYYEPNDNRVVVGRDQSATDAASSVVNESVHAAAYQDGRSADPASMSKDQYVDSMVREEAQSSATEIEHRRELAAQGQPTGTATTALDRRYGDAYDGAIQGGHPVDAAREAGRAAVLEGVRNGDAVAGVSGEQYGDYYARQYDRVASGEIKASEVQRSNDAAPLQNPEKIGVVLNAPASELPTVEALQAQGVSRARLSLSAGYLQVDEHAEYGTPGAALDEGKVGALENRLRDYKNGGIDVTVNLPPELVNGKPEFPRTGTPQYTEGDPMIHQHGEVQDVPDEKWNPYQAAYVGRTAELASRLGPVVDNWEVGNEPDALEKVHISGTLDPREGDPPGTPNPDQTTVRDQNGIERPVKGSFDPGLPPARYGQLLNASYQAIKDNDTGARDPNDPTRPDPNNKNNVITAGLVAGDAEESFVGDGRPGSYLERAWNATPGGLKFDAMAVHPYTKNDGESFEATANNYARLGEQLTGHPVQVYMTEASPGGGSPNDPGYQRDYQNYVRDIAGATDRNGHVAGTYFFWGGTFDSHAGLTQMPGASDTLKTLLGK